MSRRGKSSALAWSDAISLLGIVQGTEGVVIGILEGHRQQGNRGHFVLSSLPPEKVVIDKWSLGPCLPRMFCLRSTFAQQQLQGSALVQIAYSLGLQSLEARLQSAPQSAIDDANGIRSALKVHCAETTDNLPATPTQHHGVAYHHLLLHARINSRPPLKTLLSVAVTTTIHFLTLVPRWPVSQPYRLCSEYLPSTRFLSRRSVYRPNTSLLELMY